MQKIVSRMPFRLLQNFLRFVKCKKFIFKFFGQQIFSLFKIKNFITEASFMECVLRQVCHIKLLYELPELLLKSPFVMFCF